MPAKTAFQSGRLAEPGGFEPLVLPRKKRRLSRCPKIDLRPLLLPKINRHDPQRDQEFESLLLRRPVRLTSDFRAHRRKDPAFAASVSPDETRERDVLAPRRLALVAFL